MQQYLDLLRRILDTGAHRPSRGVVGGAPVSGARSLFGEQMRFNLADGFPLVTTKRVAFSAIVHELLWFVSGDTNVRALQTNGVNIWNEWADENGELGPVYGRQWRHWGWSEDGTPGVDQLAQLIAGIRRDPYGRRHILTAWNVTDIDKMALPPCHCLAQFYVVDGKLSCQLYQRSGDVFLGVPYNIASYALLTHLIANDVGLDVGDFIHTFGDVHLYDNHFDQAREQLTREPRGLPVLLLKEPGMSVMKVRRGDVELVGYDPDSAIRAAVVV